ncbi:hypothetical protein F4Y93_10600, partial [Candidatus Poribacteria bacterium]|nr:hypothetical protein [Candidatus Poribacteria bacterium]
INQHQNEKQHSRKCKSEAIKVVIQFAFCYVPNHISVLSYKLSVIGYQLSVKTVLGTLPFSVKVPLQTSLTEN